MIASVLVSPGEELVESIFRRKLKDRNETFQSSRKTDLILSPEEINQLCSFIMPNFYQLPKVFRKGETDQMLKQLHDLRDSVDKAYTSLRSERRLRNITKEVIDQQVESIENFVNSGSGQVDSVYPAIEKAITMVALEAHNYQKELRYEYLELKSVVKESVSKAHAGLKNFYTSEPLFEVPENGIDFIIPAPLTRNGRKEAYALIYNVFVENKFTQIPTKGSPGLLLSNMEKFRDCCYKVYKKIGFTTTSNSYQEDRFNSELKRVKSLITSYYPELCDKPKVDEAVREMMDGVAIKTYQHVMSKLAKQ